MQLMKKPGHHYKWQTQRQRWQCVETQSDEKKPMSEVFRYTAHCN